MVSTAEENECVGFLERSSRESTLIIIKINPALSYSLLICLSPLLNYVEKFQVISEVLILLERYSSLIV